MIATSCRPRGLVGIAITLSLGLLGPALAQAPGPITTPADRFAAYEEHRALTEATPFPDLDWQFLGPTNISGRVTDVAVATPRGETYAIFAGTASGGLWRTTNEGHTWKPVFEQGPTTTIGDVTIAPSDQNIVWIGTGEANIFRSSMAGAGVYKSTDGGDTWEHKGLAATHTIPRIVIHPTDPNVVYVASSGHEWTPNPERGVFKSTDGGDSWQRVFHVNDMTGAIDLVIDPSDANTLYVATWQRVRKRWNDPRNEEGYSESGIYKTTDAGKNWTRLTEGLPDPAATGRIGIDIAASNPDVVYAFIDNYEIARPAPEGATDSYGRPMKGMIKGAELYRSNDGGETWAKASENNQYMLRLAATYGWVFGQMRVDPTDENTVYVMGLGLNVSNDAGKTFRRLGGMHGDHHGLWIDPENPKYLVNSNDGGLNVSYDGGENWTTFTDRLPVAQFYNVGYDMDEPFRVYGSIQDHGSMRGVVNISRGRDRISATDWERAPGGEASTHVIDPRDPNLVYSAGFYGQITRNNLETGEREPVAPSAEEGEMPLRGQWLAPFIISPHNPDTIYHGMNRLYKSISRGDDFEPISPDLTNNNVDEIGDIPYQTIFSISESPLTEGLIYVGTDDGLAHVTRDGGKNWTNINAGLAEQRWVSRVIASRYDDGTVYLAQNGKRHDDFAAYLFRSTDYGATWQDISANIPLGPINVIREDPFDENILYVGTDLGVYVSVDAAKSWHSLPGGLPTTFVHDLVIHPRDKIMVIATHGRGMYALDITPINIFAFFGGGN